MFSTLKQQFDQRFSRWLTRRVPPSAEHELKNRSIFIFPTAFGFCYLSILILLFVLGTNYQNNVIILLCYLMGSFFITVQMVSYFNFKGLKLKSFSDANGFAGQTIPVDVALSSQKTRFGLNLQFTEHVASYIDAFNESLQTQVSLAYAERGVKSPGRLKVFSEYAFGLFKVWTWLDFGHQITVYPKPKKLIVKQIQTFGVSGEEGTNTSTVQGHDDFHELANYKEGESLSRVAWKQLARGQGKLTKHYVQEVGEAKWLSLDSVPNAPIEDKLSYLCYVILQYQQSDGEFGLQLGDVNIAVGRGKSHCQACLTALAKH